MSNPGRLAVNKLNPHLICALCRGYFIDATTIVECLHTFCKSCIVRYLESSKFCPVCDVQVHKTKPLLSIRPDKTLQNIVYKLVPRLYQNELSCRKLFYDQCRDKEPLNEEDGGNHVNQDYILSDESISVALKPLLNSSEEQGNELELCTRYFNCPANVNVSHLKRLLRAKFDLPLNHPINFFIGKDETLKENYTLTEVAYMTSWQKKEPLTIYYKIFFAKKIKFDPEINERVYNLNVKSECTSVDSTSSDVAKCEYPVENLQKQCSMEKVHPLIENIKKESLHIKYDFVENITCDALEKVIKDSDIGIHCSNDLQISCTSAYKAIIPAPSKTSKVLDLNSITIPTVESITNGPNCLNYGLNVLTNSNGILSNIFSGNILDTTKFAGTVLPFGLTFAPSLLCTSYPDQQSISNFTLFGQNDDMGSNLILPLATLDATVLPLPSLTRQTSHSSVLSLDNLRTAPQTLLPKENKKPKYIRPKEDTKLKPDKEVQLMITEAGVMLVSGGGDNPLNHLETVMKPVESEANELLDKIENDALLASSENYSDDSNKSDGSDTGERLAQIKQEISSILDTLSKEANDNINFNIYNNTASESINIDNAPICNVTSSTMASIVNSDSEKLKKMANLNAANKELLNINNNIIPANQEVKLTHKQKDAQFISKDKSNGKSTKEKKKNQPQEKQQNECKQNPYSSRKPKEMKTIKVTLDNKSEDKDKYISTHATQVEKCIKPVIPVSTFCSHTAISKCLRFSPKLVASIPSKLSTSVSSNTVSKTNVLPNESKVKVTKNVDNSNHKVVLPVKPINTTLKNEVKKKVSKKYQPIGYKTLKKTPKCWNPTIPREKLPIKSFQNSPKTNKFFKARNGCFSEKSSRDTITINEVPSSSSNASISFSTLSNITSKNLLSSQSSEFFLSNNKNISLALPEVIKPKDPSGEVTRIPAPCEKFMQNEVLSALGKDMLSTSKSCRNPTINSCNNKTATASKFLLSDSLDPRYSSNINKDEGKSFVKTPLKAEKDQIKKNVPPVSSANKKKNEVVTKPVDNLSTAEKLDKIIKSKNIEKTFTISMNVSSDSSIANLKSLNSSPQILTLSKESEFNSSPASTIPCLSYDSSMHVYLQTIASLSNAHHQSRDQMLLNYTAPYSLLPYTSCSSVSCNLSPTKSVSATNLTAAVSDAQTKSSLLENVPLMQDILRLPQNISPSKHSFPVSEASMTPDKSNLSKVTVAKNLSKQASTRKSCSSISSSVPLDTTTITISRKENSSLASLLKPDVPIHDKKELTKKIMVSPDSKSNCLPPPNLVNKLVSQKVLPSSQVETNVNMVSSVPLTSDMMPKYIYCVGNEKDSDKTKNHMLQLTNNLPDSSYLENNKSSAPIASNSISEDCNAIIATTSLSSIFIQSCSDGALSSSYSVAELNAAEPSIPSHSIASSNAEVSKDLSSQGKVDPGNVVQNAKVNSSESKLATESPTTVISSKNITFSNLNLTTAATSKEIFAESELNLIAPITQPTLSSHSTLDNIASATLSHLTTNQMTLSTSVLVNSKESSCPTVSSINSSSATDVPSANPLCMQTSILAPTTCPSYDNIQLPLNQITGHSNQSGTLNNHANENVQTYTAPMQSVLSAEFSATTSTVKATSASSTSVTSASSTSVTSASATSTSSVLASTAATPHISTSGNTYTGVSLNNCSHAHHLKNSSSQISQEISDSSVNKNAQSKGSEPVNLIANSSLTILNNLVSLVNVGAVSNPTLFSNEITTISTTVKSQTNLEIGHSPDDKKLHSCSNKPFSSKDNNCVSNCSVVTSSQYKTDYTSHASISKQKADKIQPSVSSISKGESSNSDDINVLQNATNTINHSLGSKMPLSLGVPASQSTPLTVVSNQDNNLTSAEELDRLLFQSISAATCKSANLSHAHEMPIGNETPANSITSATASKSNIKQVKKSTSHANQNDLTSIDPSLSTTKTIPAEVSYASQGAGYNSCNLSNQCIYHNNSSAGCQANNRMTCQNSKHLLPKEYGSHCLLENVHSGVIANSITHTSNSTSTQVLGTNNSSLPLTSNLITKQCTNYPVVSTHSFMPSVTPVYTNEACKISLQQSSQTNQILTESQKTQQVAASIPEQSSKNNVNTSAISQNKIEIAASNSTVQSSVYTHDNTSTTTTQTNSKKVQNNSSGYADGNHLQPSNNKVNYNQNTQEFSSTSFNSMVNNFHEGMSGAVPSNLSSSASHKTAPQFSWEGNPFFFNSNSFNGMTKGFPSNSESCIQQNLIRSNDSLTKDANMNSDSQSNFMLPADSSFSKNSMLNSQYNIDNSIKKNAQTSESYNNFSATSQKYNTSNSALYNSNYNNNYMNFFSNSQSQVTPSLTSLVSGAAGYNFPLSNSKFNTSQQYFNFGQNMSNNSYFPSTNFNMNCGSNYQNCMNQSSGNGNPSTSNMNSNFGNNFSGSFCNLPLPYYSNCSFSYNSYPYFYQGGDMSLLSNHAAAAASLMPSFSSRSSLSPRNTTSSQSFNDLHLQSGLFPMMPFVSPLSSSVSRSATSPMSMPLSPALSMRPFSNTPYPQKSSYGIHQQSSDLLKSSSSTPKVANTSGAKPKKSNNQSHGGSKLKGSSSGNCANMKTAFENSKSAMPNEGSVNPLQPHMYNAANQSNYGLKNSDDRGRKEYKPASDNQRSRDKSQTYKGSGGAS